MALQLRPYLSYFDKSFKESQTRNYTLIIQLYLEGLDYVVYNEERNKYIGFESFKFTDIDGVSQLPLYIGKILNHRESFAFPYNKVLLMYQNRFSTIVPQPLFKEENKNLYLGFNQPFVENSRIVYDSLKNNNSVNVYYIPNMVVEKLKDFWPNVRILHYSSGLIETLSITHKNKTDQNSLFINVRENCFDVVHFMDNKLNFHNTFEFITKEDFIYFLLITIDQLGLNPEETNLIILGNIDKTDQNFNMINQYIKNYSFIDRNENFQYSFVLDELQYYKYHSLFNALQCE
jgi:hypothetical protein